MISKWNYLPLTEKEKQAKEILSRTLGLDPYICELLVLRGVTNETDAKKFFRPQLSDLYDPFLLNDMDKAVNRLNKAMGSKEKILIYGDYDVDGTTAVALVYKFLQNFYSGLDCYIPDRYDEGYGISIKGIDYAEENGFSLIIALDCGIKAIEKVEYAKSKGIDFIICDHHVPDKELPGAVAVLDPKRDDSTYPYQHLSGCGVGFKFMQAFAISNNLSIKEYLFPLLDLMAVSIASDIVPITDENRILAFHGLKQLNSNPSNGLKAIIDLCGLKNKDITTSDIVFKIGPRINASGRVQSGKEAVDLLISKDPEGAKEKGENLLENFGGHTYAAGLSLQEENIPTFIERFENYVAENILPEQMMPQIDIDATIDFKDITPSFLKTLKQFNPFGPGNTKPIFCTKRVLDYGTSRLVGRELEHLKLEMVDSRSENIMNGIAFGMHEHNEYIKAHHPFDICYTIEENTHNKNIQLMIKDIQPSK